MTRMPTRPLRAALGDYPHTAPIKSGEIAADGVAFEFAAVKPISRAFAAMVREQKFDVSEIAIATFLMAKAYGIPLVLVPAVMLGRFQHGAMLCNAERGRLTPADLPGKIIGVRAYSQTTGLWLRGILEDDYGVDVATIRWVTFEGAHVAQYEDPPGVVRAAPGSDMTTMLLAGEIDAAIYGADMPKDPRLVGVVADPDREASHWYDRHGIVPVNHLVCVTAALAQRDPGAVVAVYEALRRAKAAAGLPKDGMIDLVPFGVAALRRPLELAIRYATRQKLLPRPLTVDELFDDTTRAMAD
jgi:4,5-dihydroxyphthalate decarboxylase